MSFSLKNFASLLKVALDNGASDIHLRTDETPSLRIASRLYPIQTKTFTKEDILAILSILTKNRVTPDQYGQHDEMDGSFEIKDLCRLRYNFYRYMGMPGIVLRLIKTQIPSLEDLGLPEALAELSLKNRGLILVTGATGSGKSTTLAAMVNEINHNDSKHIVTLEDPIEYVHAQIKSRITQRELGADTKSFRDGLRAALRQDPDVLLIGELRDRDTIETALKAAETGHLVLTTIHTTDAASSISRIISMFDPHEQGEVRKRLSESLNATISQRLLPKANSKGVVVAQEIMINSPGVRECILGEQPIERIHTILEKASDNSGDGSKSFDFHIGELLEKQLITEDTARSAVSNEQMFMRKFTFSD